MQCNTNLTAPLRKHKRLNVVPRFSWEMTSTNDGKEVKSYQTSGPKGKTYFIELYKVRFILIMPVIRW